VNKQHYRTLAQLQISVSFNSTELSTGEVKTQAYINILFTHYSM